MLREARRAEGKGKGNLLSNQCCQVARYSLPYYIVSISILNAYQWCSQRAGRREGEMEEGFVSSLCCGHMFCIIIVVKCLDSVFYFVFSFVFRADKMLFYQLAVYEVAFLFAF